MAVFRVFLNLGLKLNGGEYSQKAIDDELEYIESFYGEHVSRRDHTSAQC
jgi:hypothetical protein